MLFTSNGFIFAFLPLSVLMFFLAAKINHRLAIFSLIAASLFFYGWWSPRFLLLLMASVIQNYFFGQWIHRHPNRKAARWILFLAIAIDLAALGYFKYANFFIATANYFNTAPWGPLNIVLPLGISFFTFTQIAFLVDVYRGTAKERHFSHYLLFVTYFPHLIAGPILHHQQMMPQFASKALFSLRAKNIAIGLTIFIIGLTKKVLLADGFSLYAAPVFDAVGGGLKPEALTAWTGALAYALQLYFDFSGYSDMAIGASRLFGIHLPINFNSPYQAENIIEFWRRWHISLSNFLREYLYFPLGGNRRGKMRRYFNLWLTMLLGGAWHGANWTFVIWGGIHGLLLIINHAWRGACEYLHWRPSGPIFKMVSRLMTFTAVVIAWVFFRANHFGDAFRMLAGLFGKNGLSAPHVSLTHSLSDSFCALFDKNTTTLLTIKQGHFIVPLVIGLFIIWFLPNSAELFQERNLKASSSKPIYWRPSFQWAFFIVLILLVDFLKNFGAHLPPSPFLYFQF